MSFRHSICCLLLAAGVLAPAAVSAAAGDGLQAGNLTVHPGLTLGTTLNSNVYRQAQEEGSATVAPSVKLVPFLTMSSLNGDAVDFRLDARVGWEQYIGIELGTVNGQSGLSADVGADLAFNKAGAVSFALGERLQRTNEPPPDPSREAYNRLTNRVGATLGVHPGGRVFQHFLSYDWLVYLYDEFPEINKQAHDFTLKNYWRFLPKTAAVLNADFQVVQYAEPDRGQGVLNANSTPLRLTGGISGLFTKRLSLRLLGGWGIGFYDGTGPDFNSYLIDTQLAFMFGTLAEKNRLFLGYERNFQDSTVANFASYHRPYAGYEQGFMNRRLRLGIKADAMLRAYEGTPIGDFVNDAGVTVGINEPLSDVLVGVGLNIDFDIRKWWEIGLGYSFKANLTDNRFQLSSGPDVVREYQQHLITLGTTVRY